MGIKDRNVQVAAGALAAGATAVAGRAAIKRLTDSDAPGAYRLRADEDPSDGVRRIALGRIDHAIEQLCDCSDDDLAGAVHESRKDLKKIRAVVRLVRDELGGDLYRTENARFRDTGRLLSGVRDAEVKLATLRALEERFPGRLNRGDVPRYREILHDERNEAAGAAADDTRGQVDEAAARLRQARGEIESWPLRSDGWELVAGGLGRSYSRGRRRYQAAAKDPSDEKVHELRKRVKDLWYHLRILRDANPEANEAAAADAHELSDLLGDHHDLAVLREDLEGRGADLRGATTTVLEDAIARRQDELMGPALALGKRVYSEKRKPFVKRLGGDWAAWREDGR